MWRGWVGQADRGEVSAVVIVERMPGDPPEIHFSL
jgi:hypothetical protein